MKNVKFFLFFFIFFYVSKFSSQTRDSADLYQRIKNFAAKTKLGKIILRSFYLKDGKKIIYNSDTQIEEHEHCIIRKINIRVLDPYGEVSDDSIRLNFFEKTVNRFHFSTKKWIISNKLLFKSGTPLIPLELSESERALRQTGYINDAVILVNETDGLDSVDVTVIVKDKWATSLPIQILSSEKISLRFQNTNLLGFGQTFEQSADIDLKGKNRYSGRYYIENIRNTYLSNSIFYSADSDQLRLGIDLQRATFSPLIKWGGGIYFENNQIKALSNHSVDNNQHVTLQSTYYDCWIVRRFTFNRKSVLAQNVGFSLGARTFSRDYQKRNLDVESIAQNYLMYRGILGMCNIYLQKFYKEKFIYRFGATEDIPVGIISQLTFGLSTKENAATKNYLSTYIRIANNFKMGYLSSSFLLATFFNPNSNNEVFLQNTYYFFSKLFSIKKWHLRQFFHLEILKDINENLNKKIIFKAADIYALPSGELPVFFKAFINLETVVYAPYQFIGFKFAPVVLIGTGIVNQNTSGLENFETYHALALGILFRNENLSSNTFQFSVGFYPHIPNGKSHLFKLGPVTSFTLRVNGFSAFKPVFAEY